MSKLLESFVGKFSVYNLQYYLRGISNQEIVIKRTVPALSLSKQKYFSSQSNDQQEKSVQHQTEPIRSEEVKPFIFTIVKETSKTASYLGVICLGVGMTGLICYTIFHELFSSKSPTNIYSKALEKVISNTRVQDALGEPIRGCGEVNGSRRRQYVSHFLYAKDGENRMRMKFYIFGTRKKATVHLEMKEDDAGNYSYRYLFVELDGLEHNPIMLEDNRHIKSDSITDSYFSPLKSLLLSTWTSTSQILLEQLNNII